jgi:hypothetical protein
MRFYHIFKKRINAIPSTNENILAGPFALPALPAV